MPRGGRGGLKPEGTPGSLLGRLAGTVRSGVGSGKARSLGGLWGAEGVALVTALVQSMFVARVLGPRTFGIAALVLSIPAFVFTFLDPQSEAAVVRYLAEFEKASEPRRAAAVVKTAYYADLALAAAASLAIALVAGWAADHVVDDPATTYLIVVAALGLSTAGPAATSRAVLSTYGRFQRIASLSVVASVIRNGLVMVLVGAGHGIRGVVYGAVLGQLFESGILYLASRRVMREKTGLTWTTSSARALQPHVGKVVRFMAYTELTTLSTALTKHGDVLLLGAARGPADVGFYRLASSIAAIAGRVITPLQAVVYPDMARAAAAGDGGRVTRLARRHFVHIGLPLALLGAATLPLVGWVVRLAAGEQYGPAVRVCQVIIAGTLISLATYWLRPLYMAAGRVRQFFGLTAVVTVATFAGMAIGADRYGAVGVAEARALGSGLLGTGVALLALRMARTPLIRAQTSEPPARTARVAGTEPDA